MSKKFLEQIESLMPDDALDNIIEGKRALQRFLSNKGVKNVAVEHDKDEMTFTLDDGSQVVVEVTDYKKVDGVEDGEVDTQGPVEAKAGEYRASGSIGKAKDKLTGGLGTKAVKAVERREKLVKDAIPVYDKITNMKKTQLQNLASKLK